MRTTPFISYAQNGEDIVVDRVLRDVVDGFYVDVGAADPIGYSATYAMYLLGWHGINVEPVPAFAHALRVVRPRDLTLQCAAGEAGGSIELNVVVGTGLSTGSVGDADRLRQMGFQTEVVAVDVHRLDELLDEHCEPEQPIHLLKVDVEGMEDGVLRGLDLARWRPWLVIVEATEPLSQRLTHDRWEWMLTEAGYSFELFDGLNRYYLASEHAELRPRLSCGPCVFDQPYQRADVSLAIERHREISIEQLTLADQRAHDLQLELERVANDRNELAAHLEQVRADWGASIEALGAERDAYHDAYRNVSAQLEIAGVENQRLTAAVSALEAHSRAILADSDAALADLRARSNDLERRLAQLVNSLSWRLTAPMRGLRSRL